MILAKSKKTMTQHSPSGETDRSRQPMFTVTSNITDVETTWRELEGRGIHSPGQSFDFVKNWVFANKIAPKDQFYLKAYLGKQTMALLPLHRTKRFGASILTWFLGSHVACNGALINEAAFAELSEDERLEFWQGVVRALPPADAVYLPSVPTGEGVRFETLEGMGKRPVCDKIYRARFDSWDEIDKSRRDRKRRKRDKQHRQKLDALGEVQLQRIEDKQNAKPVLAKMFELNKRRFEVLGIENPFETQEVQDFYLKAFDAPGDAKPVIYALMLDGEMIGARYCVQQNGDLFMLISTMSDDEEVMPGSPGHQCLLETFKVAFDQHGVDNVDIGIGASEEKRRWCNDLQPVCNRFVPRTAVGWIFFSVQSSLEYLKRTVKHNKKLFGFYKSIRGFLPPVLRT